MVAIGLWYIYRGQPQARALSTTTIEGLPVAFVLVQDSIASGQRTVVYRSSPLLITRSSDPSLLHDPGFEGQVGTYVSAEGTDPPSMRVWVHVPVTCTLTLFPSHLPAGVEPRLANWVQQAADYTSTVQIVSQSERVVRLEGSDWVPALGWQEVCPPVQPCDALASTHPFAVEYHAVFSGQVQGVTLPASLMHYLYRVPVSP